MLIRNRKRHSCPPSWLRAFATTAFLLGAASSLRADTVTATWDPNPEPDIAGYTLSYGITSGQYTTSVDAGNVTNRQVTLSPGARYYFVVQAYNTAGLVSPRSAEASIDLGILNRAPTLTAPAPQSSLENASVSHQLIASDPDGNPLIYSATGLPPSLAVNSATGLISGTLSYTSAGTYSVIVTVSDGLLAANVSFTWTVTNVNRAPTLATIANQNSAENTSVSLQLAASDPDGQVLTYNAIGLPPSLAISPVSGLISGTLSYSSAGTYSVTAILSDGSLTLSRTFSWTVTNTNRTPTLTAVANQNDAENNSVSLQLAASDPDGQALTYSGSGLPSSLTINPTSGLISGTLSYTSAGTHSVTATVSDGSLTASRTFTWTVANVNRAPTLAAAANQNSAVNNAASLQLTGSDPDGQAVTYGASGLPLSLTINSTSGLISGTLTSTSAGTYTVTAIVSDGNLSASMTFTWTVTSVNRPPTLSAITNQRNSENNSVSLQLAASDPDGQPLTYGATGLPPTLSVNSATGHISGTLSRSSAGLYTVVASVSDGDLSESRTFTWTVTKVGSELTRAGDFDGDGRMDMASYRSSTGEWSMAFSRTDYTTNSVVSWGTGTDRPVPGEYDGDGRADIVIYRSPGLWSILPSSTGYTTGVNLSLGRKTDRPVPADYDGDGKTDIAVFRPSNATWQIRHSSANYATGVSLRFGASGDRLVPADYDGDGKADIAVFKESGLWSVLLSGTNNTGRFEGTWGASTDIPVPADYDGDGAADIAFYRPSTGAWHVLRSSSNFTSSTSFVHGGPGDIPVPGDYDGDGMTDYAVFRSSTAAWVVLKSSTLYTSSITATVGVGTDLPLPVLP